MTKPVFTLGLDLNSPSFIASADIHLGKKLYNIPELEEDLKDNFVRLADLAIEKKVNYLIIAGDLFESNLTVRPNMIAFVANQVTRLKGHNIRTVGIAGDHDKPVLGDTWIQISGIEPVTVEPTFAGIDYFDYSTVSVNDVLKLIKGERDCTKVLWLFLHCQFPQIFDRAEAKKLIDYNQLKLFENFPNIQGIIAGDIHFAPETKAYGIGREAYVGYPGSLGINDRSEYKHDKHVLWCDGQRLTHLPFQLLRQHRDIDFRGKEADTFDVTAHVQWAKDQSIKPIIYVNYDIESENQIQKIVPLYEYALVKRTQLAVGVIDPGAPMEVSCRTEVSTDDKVEKALRFYCGNDEELYKLSAALLKDDVKTALDKFKEGYKL